MLLLDRAYYHGYRGSIDNVSRVIRVARSLGISGAPDVATQWGTIDAGVSVYCTDERWQQIKREAGV